MISRDGRSPQRLRAHGAEVEGEEILEAGSQRGGKRRHHQLVHRRPPKRADGGGVYRPRRDSAPTLA